MLLIEGIPAITLGLLVFAVLADRPAQARWLSDVERNQLTAEVDKDRAQNPPQHSSFAAALKDWRTYALCWVYFSVASGVYLISFWLPRMLREVGSFAPWQLGLVVAIPYLFAAITMVIVGAHSDRTNERRWHFAIAGIVGAISVVAATQSANVTVVVLLFTIATAAMLTMSPLFWTIPTTLLVGTAAAGGIALINSVGNLSGFVAPLITGWISDTTGSFRPTLWLNAGVLLSGIIVLLVMTRGTHGLAIRPDAGKRDRTTSLAIDGQAVRTDSKEAI